MSQKVEQPENEIKLFGKWSFEGIDVNDLGLKKYLSIKPTLTLHSGGRHEHQRFEKSKVDVIERLANNLMRHGRNGGKKAKTINIVKSALEVIFLKTGRNPIEVVVRAIENSAPCEDTTRVGRGGIVYNRAVDISPQRRVDMALRALANGATNASFKNAKPIEECLSDELIAAAEKDSRSFAISKRNEMERVALSSR